MTAVRRTWQNITDVLTREQTEILRTALLLMVPTLLTKLTGQVVTVLIATRLGTGQAINEFNLASTLPEALLNILLLGVMGVVLIPIFIERKQQSEEGFLRLYNTVFNLAILVFILVTVLIFLTAGSFMPWLIDNVIRPLPSEYPSPQSMQNVIEMMRFLMIPNLILAVSVLISTGLNVYNRILLPHFAPLFYNFGRMFSVFILLPLMHDNPWALVWGVLIGSVLHLLVQLPLIPIVRLKYIFVLDWRDPALRKLLSISLPRGFAFASETVGTTFLRLMATGLGGISAFNYANSLALVIPTIFGTAFATAAFPAMSGMFSRQKYAELNTVVISTLGQIMFLALPFTITMLILRLPLTRLVYGILPDTQFNRDDTMMVAWLLLFFSVGMLFEGARWFLYRLFYVAQNTLIPLLSSIISLILTVLIGIVLMNLFSYSDTYSLRHIPLDLAHLLTRSDGRAAVGGLAAAFSVTSILEVFLLLAIAHTNLLKLDLQSLWKGAVRKLMPAGAMAAVMFVMYRMWDTSSFPIDATPNFSGSTTLNLLILTGVTVLTSFMVYYLLCLLFKVEELKILRRFLNPVFRMGGLEIQR